MKTYGKVLPFFLLSLAAIVAATALSVYFPIWGNIPLNIILPIYLLITTKMVSFEKIKLSTLIIGRALTALTAFTLLPPRALIITLAILMYINISEATVSDFKKKRYWNGIAGLAMLASTHLLFNSQWTSVLTGDNMGLVHIGYYMIQAKGILLWAVAYTLWNWNFVTGEFSPSVSLYHLAILATPALISAAFLNPGIWVLARATSLTSGGVFQIACKERVEKELQSPGFTAFVSYFQKSVVQIPLMIAVIILSVLSIVVS